MLTLSKSEHFLFLDHWFRHRGGTFSLLKNKFLGEA